MLEISAGGIVFRRSRGKVELLLIEDRFRKVSFAKGRVEPGEELAQTALREVQEETGLSGRLDTVLGSVKYQYHDSARGKIDKTVTYYLIEATGGSLKPQLEEISRVRWVSLEEAEALHRRQGYRNNNQVLTRALDILKCIKA